MADPAPRVEFLWWNGCPSWDAALSELRSVMEELGLDPAAVELRQVDTDEAAADERFVGSPTIRVNGADLQDPGAEAAGLTCRVYKLRDGRISALPDPEDVRQALADAIAEAASD